MDSMEERYDDARSYLVSRYPATIFEEDQTKVMTPWNVLCYHKFFQKFHTEWNISTAILLDVGGGPCIYSHICAAPYVAEIYHSDYVKACRDEVLLWKNNDPNAYDWSPYFRHVVNTLEGQGSPSAVSKRKDMLHKVLKDTVFCDVNADVIAPAVSTKVNIITCNFCLDSSCGSMDGYISALERIYQMLTPRGFFVLLSNLGCSWYKLNDIKYFTGYTLSIEEIEKYLKKIGFVLRHSECKEKALSGRNISNDTIGQAFVVAQKT